MYSTSQRLGLIACRYLVEKYEEQINVSAPDIAQKYNMNVRALMPALRKLTQAGILNSQIGGKAPGFMFSKDPKNISLYEVIIELSEERKTWCCRNTTSIINCGMQTCDSCNIYRTITGGMDKIHEVFKHVSVFDHCKSAQKDTTTI